MAMLPHVLLRKHCQELFVFLSSILLNSYETNSGPIGSMKKPLLVDPADRSKNKSTMPRLSVKEAIVLANHEAIKKGYDLSR